MIAVVRTGVHNATMCGRFSLDTDERGFRDTFAITNEIPAAGFHAFNIAPDQGSENRSPRLLPVVRHGAAGNELAMMQWWLLPHWSREPFVKYSTFNARSDTVAKSPTFRDSFRSRRCLVPASGFYEWEKRGGAKLPWNVRVRGAGLFAMAGLWDRWERGGQVVESFSVIVTEANSLMRPIHDRMPVILQPQDYARWLNPGFSEVGELLALLKPYPSENMDAFRVSTRVNNARNEGPELAEPIASPVQ